MLFSDSYDEIREAFVEANFDQDADAMRKMFDEWATNYAHRHAQLAYCEGASTAFIRRDLTLNQVFAKSPYYPGDVHYG